MKGKMFMVPKSKFGFPPHSGFSRTDWRVLAAFWHPVATSIEVTDKPYGTTLLDTGLVVYRSSGRVSVAVDICPHRGARLSRGRIDGDNLVCPYHGLVYDAAGACVFIPAEGRRDGIVAKLSLRTLRTAERFGIIWASFAEEPVAPLPDWSTLESDAVVSEPVPPEIWNVAAARHAENFNDIAHVPWVHNDTFGALAYEVPHYTLERADTDLRHYYHETGNTQLFERHRTGRQATQARPIEDVLFDYKFRYPFASSLEVSDPEGRTIYVFDVVQPISFNESRIYKIVARNFDLDGPMEGAVRFEQAVNREDREILESMLPNEPSLYATTEVPIKADRWSIAYRRGLVGFGMGKHGDATPVAVNVP